MIRMDLLGKFIVEKKSNMDPKGSNTSPTSHHSFAGGHAQNKGLLASS